MSAWLCLVVALVTAAMVGLVYLGERQAGGAHGGDPDRTDYQAKFLDDERKSQ